MQGHDVTDFLGSNPAMLQRNAEMRKMRGGNAILRPGTRRTGTRRTGVPGRGRAIIVR